MLPAPGPARTRRRLVAARTGIKQEGEAKPLPQTAGNHSRDGFSFTLVITAGARRFIPARRSSAMDRIEERVWESEKAENPNTDRKSTRLNSSHVSESRMPS